MESKAERAKRIMKEARRVCSNLEGKDAAECYIALTNARGLISTKIVKRKAENGFLNSIKILTGLMQSPFYSFNKARKRPSDATGIRG